MKVKRSCPHCNSDEVYRSHRRGTVEKYILRVVGVRPYRCANCDARFYGFAAAIDEATPPHLKAA
ncbi:MAG TPA: hypothetical protein VMJ13_06820 [Candidatus Acidoferrum sp.]|nr:hypothetical protein [Candidatus Acidoferrum sp.]